MKVSILWFLLTSSLGYDISSVRLNANSTGQQDYITAFSYMYRLPFKSTLFLPVFGTTKLFWTLFKIAIVHKINIYPRLNLGFVIDNLTRNHFNKFSKFYVILLIKVRQYSKFDMSKSEVSHVQLALVKLQTIITFEVWTSLVCCKVMILLPKNRRYVLYSTLLLVKTGT